MAVFTSKTKVRKNFIFPIDLAEWAEKYAHNNNTTMTRLIIDHFTDLRRQAEALNVEQV